MLVHHLRVPSWPCNCLQDPFFEPCRIKRMNGSRIHVRCTPRLGGGLLCTPKQLRHYHSPDKVSWDEWPLSDREVKHIDLEYAANPEKAGELKEMTADEMAVDGSYVVAGIARHEYTGLEVRYPVGWLSAIPGNLGAHVSLCTARWEYQPHLLFLRR